MARDRTRNEYPKKCSKNLSGNSQFFPLKSLPPHGLHGPYAAQPNSSKDKLAISFAANEKPLYSTKPASLLVKSTKKSTQTFL